jgi:hypothetical protein
MRDRCQSPFKRAIGIALFSALVTLVCFPVSAEGAEGPFTALIGSWSGTGTILLSSGAKERIRCQAQYRLGSGTTSLRLELSCESDSYKFQLRSQVSYREGAISGTWDEMTRATGGSVDGRVVGSQMRIKAEGQTFTAILSVTTQSERQSVSIQSPGSAMSDVTITMTRKSR